MGSRVERVYVLPGVYPITTVGMTTILLITCNYLPGYKAGGPIRSLANLVDRLGDEFVFRILTADRDLGDHQPYPGVETGVWKPVGKAQVMYLSPRQMGLVAWYRLLNQIDFDLIYLNSVFAPQTVYTLLLRRLRLLPTRPIVLTPRGEFSSGALHIKRLKKRLYLTLALQIGLYDRLVWQATNERERQDSLVTLERYIDDLVLQVVPIISMPNLASRQFERVTLCSLVAKHTGVVRIVFLSRISRMKNLDFALTLLDGLEGTIEFDIYGPIEDQIFWRECQQIAHQLPPNVQVSYR